MNSVNVVMLLGHLTRAPELRYTPSGAAVCQMGLALNRPWTWPPARRSRSTGVQQAAGCSDAPGLCPAPGAPGVDRGVQPC